MRHLDVRPFYGNRQHALGDTEGRRIGGCGMVEEGSDRRQAGVARGDGVVPLLLEFVEKGENEVPIELLERQRRRLLPQSGGGKEDQHPQGVAIAGHGRGSGVSLFGQAPAKVGFQERRQEQVFTHAAPPSRKARSAAMARRSTEPVR